MFGSVQEERLRVLVFEEGVQTESTIGSGRRGPSLDDHLSVKSPNNVPRQPSSLRRQTSPGPVKVFPVDVTETSLSTTSTLTKSESKLLSVSLVLKGFGGLVPG